MKYISNAFSLQMLSADLLKEGCLFKVTEVESFPQDAISVVGHADTAAVLGVEFNRTSLILKDGDVLYVAQLMGGRLPEGSTTLPEGFKFKYLKVELWNQVG